jgi:carboxyl-terminal processing protease
MEQNTKNRQRTFRDAALPLQLVLLIAVTFGLGVLFGSQYMVSQAQSGTNLPDEAEEAFAPLYETYNLIQAQFIEDVPVETLVDGAISGMVEALDDQYSAYVNAEFFPYMSQNLSGEIEGIGVTINEMETGFIEVVNVLEGTPAEQSGVEEGDVFLVVDGTNVEGLNTLELAARVRGPSGTTVEITFLRDEEEVTLNIERAPIEVPNIEAEILEGDIAYISMANFTSIARTQIDDAIEGLDFSNLNGLVFDLRSNPGGFLTTATEIAGLFMKEGTILIEEFGDGRSDIFRIEGGQVLQELPDGNIRVYSQNASFADIPVPVVVLLDERSASASELVAGAWQDNGVVTILGETSFGKGTVQLQNALVNGGGLRLTVARWLTPNGDSISEQGITPDIIVEIPEDAELEQGEDPQLEAAIDFLLTGEIPPQPDPAELEEAAEATAEPEPAP